jgi:parallel beta-helix repeat protein
MFKYAEPGGPLPVAGLTQSMQADMLQPLRDPLRLFADFAVIPPNYLIFTDGIGNVFAKNGRTGQIEFQGSDAATVIQQAINALPADGGRIFFKEGTFEVSSTITIDGRDNVELHSTGKSSLLKQKAGANLPAIILVRNSHNILLRDLSIDGNRTNNTSGAGIRVEGRCARGRIQNVWVYSAYTGIVLATDGIHLWNIEDCHVEDCYESGIAVVNREVAVSAARHTIANNYVVRTGHHGIVLSGVSDCIVVGNHLYDVGVLRTDGYAHGIGLDGNAGSNPSFNNKVIGNWIYNTRMQGIEVADRQDWVEVIGNHIDVVGGVGIYFGGGIAPSFQAVIMGNICRYCGEDGIQINSPSITNRTSNVVIEGNISFENRGHGIFVGWSSRVKVVNNICFNNDRDNLDKDGIRLGECFDAEIIGNILFDDRSPPRQNYGVAIHPNTYGMVRIMDNKIGTHQFGAIRLAGTGTRIIRRNEGYVTENSGIATFSGTGTQTTFTIPHGLVGTPTSWRVEAGSADARGAKHVTADATKLTVVFATAPPAGTNNVVLVWQAEI